jgi:hypothetical protein
VCRRIGLRTSPDLAQVLELRDELLIACREVLLGAGRSHAAALVAHIDALSMTRSHRDHTTSGSPRKVSPEPGGSGGDQESPFGRGQVGGQLRQRPARERDALVIGAGARDRNDPVALFGRRLLRAPAPIVRVKRAEPFLSNA